MKLRANTHLPGVNLLNHRLGWLETHPRSKGNGKKSSKIHPKLPYIDPPPSSPPPLPWAYIGHYWVKFSGFFLRSLSTQNGFLTIPNDDLAGFTPDTCVFAPISVPFDPFIVGRKVPFIVGRQNKDAPFRRRT